MRTHDTQLSPNIPLPSWKFLHLVIILECITSVLWMQIFGTILTTTAHNLVLKTKRLKAYGITFDCFVITIKHDLILESFLYKYISIFKIFDVSNVGIWMIKALFQGDQHEQLDTLILT